MENYNNIMNPGYTNIVYGNSMLETSHQIPQNQPLVQQNLQSVANNENNMDSENTPLENENSVLECENLKSTDENVISNNQDDYENVELPQVNDYNSSVVSESELNENKTPLEEPITEEAAPMVVDPPNEIPDEIVEDKTEIESEPEKPLTRPEIPPVIIKKKEIIAAKSRSKPSDDITTICRVCLKPGELINIFNSDGILKIHNKVMLCAAVQIALNDGLPANICNLCTDKLQVAYDFKVTCEESDLELRKRLKKSAPAIKTVVKTEFVLIECDNDFEMDDEPLASAPKRKYKEDSDDYLMSDSAPDSGSDSSFSLNKSSKSKRRQRKKRVPKRSQPKRELRTSEKKVTRRSATVTPTPSSSSKKSKIVIEDDDDDEDDRPLMSRKLDQTDGTTKHSCKICNKTFPYASFLKQHMLTHTNDKVIRCKFCTATFSKKSDQQKHINDFHAEDLDDDLPEVVKKEVKVKEVVVREKKQHKCPYCDQVFPSANLLRPHKKTHVGEKPFVCNICNKGFKQTVSLDAHIKRHKEDKSLQCELCDKYCLTKVELKRHIQDVHAEEKPYTCEHCDKAFSTKVRLEKHVLKHEKEELELSGSIKDDGKKKAPSTKDLFKSIAPITSTYWSDSYSD